MASLNYLPNKDEEDIIAAKVSSLDNPSGRETVARMVTFASLTREGFRLGDLSTLMSPRTVISWGENLEIFGDLAAALRFAFLNKCDEAEWPIVEEYFQRCFDSPLLLSK